MYTYLDRAQPGRGHLDSAAAALEAAVTAVNDIDLPPALYGGYTGVGWAIEHVRRQVAIVDEHTNDGVDEGVLAWLGRDPWPKEDHYDLISGLVGVGVYAIERLPEPGGVTCLKGVIDCLAQTAEAQPDGLTWWTPPELLNGPTRKAYPQGCYNLGVSHGMPGVIALLGEAYAAGIARERVRPLLAEAVRWLLARRQPEATGAVFPSSLQPGLTEPPQSSRLAWCYGDLGVAVALLGAARRASEPQWEAAALDIARRAAQRPPEQSGVVDAGLCHGAAGVGHLFNRLFQATGEPLYAEAARSWLRRALLLRKENQGLAGFLSYGPAPGANLDREFTWVWYPDSSFLTGVVGITLALLAAVSPVAPDWDRLLLTRL
jgi:lantibiotic modifying enzyme